MNKQFDRRLFSCFQEILVLALLCCHFSPWPKRSVSTLCGFFFLFFSSRKFALPPAKKIATSSAENSLRRWPKVRSFFGRKFDQPLREIRTVIVGKFALPSAENFSMTSAKNSGWKLAPSSAENSLCRCLKNSLCRRSKICFSAGEKNRSVVGRKFVPPSAESLLSRRL